LKSTSLAKNYTGNSLSSKQPLTNNLVGPPPALKTTKGGVQGLESGRGEVPQGLKRYNSNTPAYEFGKKEEPMEIESPTNTPGYFLPGKNATNGKPMFQGRGQGQGQGFGQQGNNGFGGMSQSQNVSGNYSNLSGNNLSLSQMGAPNVYGQPSRGNYPYNQHQQQQQPQQNAFYNNYNQGNFNKGPFPSNQNNNNFPNNNNPNNPNNFNYQNYNQGNPNNPNNPNSLFPHNRMQPQPQQYQLP
jgi:hypothetical protein